MTDKVGDGDFQKWGDDFEMGGWYHFTDYEDFCKKEFC